MIRHGASTRLRFQPRSGCLLLHCSHHPVELSCQITFLPSPSLILCPPPIPSLCWHLKKSRRSISGFIVLLASHFTSFLSPSPQMIFDIQTSGRMYSIIVYFFTGRHGNGSPGCKDKRRRVWRRGEIDDKIYSQYGIVPACLFVSVSVRL